MLSVEIANLLHVTGTYIIVALITVLVWLASAINTRRHCAATILTHADDEAQRIIKDQASAMKKKDKQIEALAAQLEKERTAHRAVDDTLRRALKISASAMPLTKE